MTEKMTIQMVAQQAGILGALESVQKNLDKMATKMDRVERYSKKASQAGKDGFEKTSQAIRSVVTTAAAALSSMVSIQKVMDTLRAKNEAIIRQGEKARQLTVEPAAAARQLRQNLQPGGIFKTREEGEKAIQDMAKKLGLTFEQFAPVAGAALSARGGLDERTALAFANAASDLNRGDVDTASAQARLGLAIAKKANITDPRKALGLVNQLQAAFPGSDPALLASSAPRAIAGTTVSGGSVEFGTRLFATLASLGEDYEGRRTANFISQLQPQLLSFTPQKEGEFKTREGNTVKLTKADIQQLSNARASGDPEKVLDVLLQNRQLGEAFIGQATGETAPLAAFSGLIRKQDEAVATFDRSNRTILPLGGNAQVDFFNQLAKDNRQGVFEGVARAGERGQAGRQAALAGTPEARRGAAREILTEALELLPSNEAFRATDIALFDETTSSAITRFDFSPIGRDLVRSLKKKDPSEVAAFILSSKLNAKTNSGESPLSPTERDLIFTQLEALTELNDNVRKIINRAQGSGKPQQPAAALNGR